jgi:uncharacterized protein YcbX
MLAAGSVLGLYRYPVKSMGGEEVEQVYVGADGFEGDRVYAVLDLETGTAASAKNMARFGRLLDVKASLSSDGLHLVFPDGRRCGLSEAAAILSSYLGRRVMLVRNGGKALRYIGLDVSYEAGSTTYFEKQGTTRAGSFHDSASVHIMTAETLKANGIGIDGLCRFRPNLLIDFDGELSPGTVFEVGGVALRVTKPTKRCIMVTLPQQTLAFNPEILKNLRQRHGGVAGFYAEVVREGWITVGHRLKIYST